jgi:hypothetical protein
VEGLFSNPCSECLAKTLVLANLDRVFIITNGGSDAREIIAGRVNLVIVFIRKTTAVRPVKFQAYVNLRYRFEGGLADGTAIF